MQLGSAHPAVHARVRSEARPRREDGVWLEYGEEDGAGPRQRQHARPGPCHHGGVMHCATARHGHRRLIEMHDGSSYTRVVFAVLVTAKSPSRTAVFTSQYTIVYYGKLSAYIGV